MLLFLRAMDELEKWKIISTKSYYRYKLKWIAFNVIFVFLIRWLFLTKGNAFDARKLFEVHLFCEHVCCVPCAMLINFYIWLLLAIFSSIYSHRFEATASTWEQCYTLLYFMVVCSCWITSKQENNDIRLCLLRNFSHGV